MRLHQWWERLLREGAHRSERSGPVVSEVLRESKTVQYMDMCVCTYV